MIVNGVGTLWYCVWLIFFLWWRGFDDDVYIYTIHTHTSRHHTHIIYTSTPHTSSTHPSTHTHPQHTHKYHPITCIMTHRDTQTSHSHNLPPTPLPPPSPLPPSLTPSFHMMTSLTISWHQQMVVGHLPLRTSVGCPWEHFRPHFLPWLRWVVRPMLFEDAVREKGWKKWKNEKMKKLF